MKRPYQSSFGLLDFHKSPYPSHTQDIRPREPQYVDIATPTPSGSFFIPKELIEHYNGWHFEYNHNYLAYTVQIQGNDKSNFDDRWITDRELISQEITYKITPVSIFPAGGMFQLGMRLFCRPSKLPIPKIRNDLCTYTFYDSNNQGILSNIQYRRKGTDKWQTYEPKLFATHDFTIEIRRICDGVVSDTVELIAPWNNEKYLQFPMSKEELIMFGRINTFLRADIKRITCIQEGKTFIYEDDDLILDLKPGIPFEVLACHSHSGRKFSKNHGFFTVPHPLPNFNPANWEKLFGNLECAKIEKPNSAPNSPVWQLSRRGYFRRQMLHKDIMGRFSIPQVVSPTEFVIELSPLTVGKPLDESTVDPQPDAPFPLTKTFSIRFCNIWNTHRGNLSDQFASFGRKMCEWSLK